MNEHPSQGEMPPLPTTFAWEEFVRELGQFCGDIEVPPTIQIPEPPEASEEQA